jgi:hypothetical protein
MAHTEPIKIRSLTMGRLEDRRAYRFVERALSANHRFEERVTWVDAETFIPLRTEHVVEGRTVLAAETREIDLVQEVPTPLRMSFEKPLEKRHVDVYVDEVDYKREIPEDVFSTLTLMKTHLEKR